MKRTILFILLFTICLTSYPQYVDSLGPVPSLNQRELQLMLQQWLRTGNAAGLVFDQVNKGGFTTFERHHDQGNHHRIQEGSSNSWLRFSSDGYSRFNDRVYARGHFSFLKHEEHDRAWSDVINTYNANPYIFGSSVRGDYDKQQFDLNLQVYMAPMGRISAGFTIDYHVADISRQRDPRSRTYFIDYSIIPAVTYQVSETSRLGLYAFYRYDKERMPNLSTVQTDPNLQYYTFTGIEHAEGRVGGYRAFQRQFISDYAGAAIQYQYKTPGTSLVISSGIDKQWQQTLGDKKQSPGSFNAYSFNSSANLIMQKELIMNHMYVNARLKNGGADEFRQSLITSRDSVSGVSTEFWVTDYIYKNRFVVVTSELHASWKRYVLRPHGKEYAWSLGAEAGWQAFSNIYYLPRSEYSASRTYAGINGSAYLLERNSHRLEFLPAARYGLALHAELEPAGESVLYENILKYDLEYHNRNTVEIAGTVKYTFPMRFVKNNLMSGYVRLHAGKLFAGPDHQQFSINLTVGLLTL